MSVTRKIEGVLLVREWQNLGEEHITYWCVGCEAGHTIQVGGDNTWTWDGDTEHPTFSPSVLSYPHERSFDPANPESTEPPKPMPRCHAFVKAGRIEYLSDSEHALAGQTVDMVPLPERYARFLDN